MKISKKEVLRYLGYQGCTIDSRMNELIESCIKEIDHVSSYKSTYKIFDVEHEDVGVKLLDSTLILKGENISKHLAGAKRCAVMAATLGREVEQKIKYYEKVDLTKSIIIHACATAKIEQVCDEVEEEIQKIAKSYGLETSFRYSPGYGDFSIEIQKEILNVLNAPSKIGLTVTDHFIMIPRKSVTAIIGMHTQKIVPESSKCKMCNRYKNCPYQECDRLGKAGNIREN